jgi:hypothetical protein
MRLLAFISLWLLIRPLELRSAQHHAQPKESDGTSRRDAAGPRIFAPVLGFVPDPAAGSVRPMFGTPASVNWGSPLDLGLPHRRLVISPSQEYALAWVERPAGACSPDAESQEGVRVLVLPLERSEPPARFPSESAAHAEAVVFSPAGTSLAFVSGGRAQIMEGLPNRPEVGFEVDLAALPGELTVLAVSDDGRFALAGPNGETAGSIWILTRDGAPRFLLTSLKAAAAFFPGSHDASVADRASNTLYLVRNAGAAAEAVSIATERDGVNDPVAVAASLDRKRLIVVNGSPGSILVLQLDGGGAQLLTSDFAVEGLVRLKGNAVFQLNPSGTTPIILDGDADQPRILAAPPYAASDRNSLPEIVQ